MKIVFMTFLIALSGCDWISSGLRSESDDAILVRKAIQAYNDFDEETYASCFSENVNFFASNGLGTTRHVSGQAELKKFHNNLFDMYKPKAEILNLFDISPWVFVHQRTKSSKHTVESSVGYRVDKGKITDVMVVGEKELK